MYVSDRLYFLTLYYWKTLNLYKSRKNSTTNPEGHTHSSETATMGNLLHLYTPPLAISLHSGSFKTDPGLHISSGENISTRALKGANIFPINITTISTLKNYYFSANIQSVFKLSFLSCFWGSGGRGGLRRLRLFDWALKSLLAHRFRLQLLSCILAASLLKSPGGWPCRLPQSGFHRLHGVVSLNMQCISCKLAVQFSWIWFSPCLRVNIF